MAGGGEGSPGPNGGRDATPLSRDSGRRSLEASAAAAAGGAPPGPSSSVNFFIIRQPFVPPSANASLEASLPSLAREGAIPEPGGWWRWWGGAVGALLHRQTPNRRTRRHPHTCVHICTRSCLAWKAAETGPNINYLFCSRGLVTVIRAGGVFPFFLFGERCTHGLMRKTGLSLELSRRT